VEKPRINSVAVGGGAYGDEGKGRIVDEYVDYFSKKLKVILYRDNGGANAGHTVEVGDKRIALHQLPSGIFTKGATVILGKGMVIHPQDLLEEIRQVKEVNGGKLPVKIIIDEMAALSLDTHRAFEGVVKDWQESVKGTTGRGIGPAYGDVLTRRAIRMRDLKNWDEDKIKKHYQLYAALIKGMDADLAKAEVNRLASSGKELVGSLDQFMSKLKAQSKELSPYIGEVFTLLSNAWAKPKQFAMIFEKAQGVGLDPRYGVYPDTSESDCTFAGISSSSEGAINADQINYRVSVIKATYMSSVGSRKLPTLITGKIAERIREDAHEYGATTKRPRDVAWIDIPALKFFNKMTKATHLGLTHMDIVYPDTPIKVCVAYKLKGKTVGYRPDQEYLLKVKPVYKEFKPWSREKIQKAKSLKEIPAAAKKFINFLSKQIGAPIQIITTGPKREQSIKLIKIN